MKYEHANDIQQRIERIVKILELNHIDLHRVVCMRSYGSKSRALARIWNFPKILQKALDARAYYVIEIISHKFDKLSREEQDRTLIHELMHIPKTFSGGLVPHKYFDKKIDRKTVDEMYRKYLNRLLDKL